MNYLAIIALIQVLQQKVLVLQAQLKQMQSAQVAYVAPLPFVQESAPINIGYSNPRYVPPVQTIGIGAPDLSSIIQPDIQSTPMTPSCTFSGTRITDPDGDRIDFIWSSQGIPEGTMGYLRSANRVSSGVPDFEYGWGAWPLSNAGMGSVVSSVNGESTSTSASNTSQWRLQFGNVYCYTKLQ